jgi:hypothetical protein
LYLESDANTNCSNEKELVMNYQDQTFGEMFTKCCNGTKDELEVLKILGIDGVKCHTEIAEILPYWSDSNYLIVEYSFNKFRNIYLNAPSDEQERKVAEMFHKYKREVDTASIDDLEIKYLYTSDIYKKVRKHENGDPDKHWKECERFSNNMERLMIHMFENIFHDTYNDFLDTP